MADPMEKYLQKINQELASIEDDEERDAQRQRVEDMLAKYDGPDRVVKVEEYLQSKADEPEVERYYTGIPTLDEKTKGFKRGDLVVISAPTGVGKTTFCQTMMEGFYKNGIQSLLFSYEVTPEDLEFSEKISYALPLELKGDTLEWIEKKIIEGKVKHNTKAVFIDHLHFISEVFNTRNQNMSTAIGVVMNKLTVMARKWNVAIFLVCHLKKTRFDEMPDMAELRDSSFIAQYAFVVIMMIRKKEEVVIAGQTMAQDSDTTIFSIQKCRGTGRRTGVFSMEFQEGTLKENTGNYDYEELAAG